jgi:hypothetical protein
MPSLIRNEWTLKKLVQNTYMHKRSRFEYMKRDVIKRITIKRTNTFDLSTNRKRTTFIIQSTSYPQYYPYFTKRDERGRRRSRQRRYTHQYDVFLQLDKLSINVPFKARTGSQAIWDKRAKAIRRNGRVIKESKNVLKGINADFRFRLEYVYAENGILFGRLLAKTPPVKTNPRGIVFADKHLLHVIKILMNKRILSQ